MRIPHSLALVLALGTFVPSAQAQVTEPRPAPRPTMVKPVSGPATKLEAFQPYPGSVLILGHEELGRTTNRQVIAELQTVRDSAGNSASGVMLFLVSGTDATERIYIDNDELPMLLKGMDAVLNVDTNPTSLKKFEVGYTTRDRLSFVAYDREGSGVIEYALESTKSLPLTMLRIDLTEMLKLRGWFELALKRLSAGGN